MANPLRIPCLLALAVAILFCNFASIRAQRREHLTPEEIELVREAQLLDQRTAVFIKAAERRLLAISDPSSQQLVKDKAKWGEIAGTRKQLLEDVIRIVDEAVVNIDDAHHRDPKSALLAKSLAMLAGATSRFLAKVAPLRESAQNIGERDVVDDFVVKADEIISAAKRHGVEDKPDQEKAGKKGAKDN